MQNAFGQYFAFLRGLCPAAKKVLQYKLEVYYNDLGNSGGWGSDVIPPFDAS